MVAGKEEEMAAGGSGGGRRRRRLQPVKEVVARGRRRRRWPGEEAAMRPEEILLGDQAGSAGYMNGIAGMPRCSSRLFPALVLANGIPGTSEVVE